MRRRSIILLSGGLDSAANLAFARLQDEPVLALTANYGQRAAPAEIAAARSLAQYYRVMHEVVDLPWLGQLGGSSLTDASREIPDLPPEQLDELAAARRSAQSVWVPNRNGVLISVAAAYAERMEAVQIVVGFNAEEAVTFPDNSIEFLNRSSKALELSTANQVRVACYTAEWNKRKIVAELRRQTPDFPFESVWSCYTAGPRPCGACESCRRQARALGGANA